MQAMQLPPAKPEPTGAMIEPGAWLGLLGGGQLGRMFTMAAQSMGYQVVVLDPGDHSPAGSVADDAHRRRLPRSGRAGDAGGTLCRRHHRVRERSGRKPALPGAALRREPGGATASRWLRIASPRSSSLRRPGSRSHRTRPSAAWKTSATALRICCPESSSVAGWATTARARRGWQLGVKTGAGLCAARRRALRAGAAAATLELELSCIVARDFDGDSRDLAGGGESSMPRHSRCEHRARAGSPRI